MTILEESWPVPDTELLPALRLAMSIGHAPMGLLLLRDIATGALCMAATEGMTAKQVTLCAPLFEAGGPIDRACAEHEQLLIRDLLAEATALPPRFRDSARRLDCRALAIEPLSITADDSIGAVAMLYRATHRARPRSAEMCAQCARLLALAVHTARQRAEAERRRDAIEGVARERIQFVARMSHELRTPLQSITGYLDLLRHGRADPPSPGQLEMLNRMERAERMVLSVINDFTDLARLEAGRVSYTTRPVRASEVMAMAEDVVAPLARRRGVHLDVLPPLEDVVALADPTKCGQVLINLLTNAIKFTPAGGVVCLAARQDAGQVWFDVTDTGPGIPRDKLSAIFDPYVQLERRVPRELAGCGLGLAIGREFARGMQGEITVRSELGTGSTFSLRLRRYQRARAAQLRKRTGRAPAR